MRVDLQIPDTWDVVNQSYRQALALGEGGYSVQTYLGLRHALWEICGQLSQLFPNRKTIGYFSRAVPVFESVAVAMSREEYTVKVLREEDLNNPAAWLEPVAKELLFLVTEADDPVTGALYEFPQLDEVLKDKRIFRLVISHAMHTCVPLTPPRALEARLLSLRADRTVALLGERVKVQPPIASGLSWAAISPNAARADLACVDSGEYETMRTRVEAFERSLPAGAVRILDPSKPRLFDRAVFAYRDIDGLALITELARELACDMRAPGERGWLETASLCRWQDERVLRGLGDRGLVARDTISNSKLTPELIRGLVILSAESLVGDVKRKLEAARARLLALQNG